MSQLIGWFSGGDYWRGYSVMVSSGVGYTGDKSLDVT